MNTKALINSLSTPQLIRARQTALSFCALLDAKKGNITRELTIPQLISTIFIDSPSVTSIIAPKIIECIEKGYVPADKVLDNILKLSFKSLSPFSVEHITEITVSCIFALGKDPSAPAPPTLHPLAELVSGCPEAWVPLATKALPALASHGITESFAMRWLWPFFRGVFLSESSPALYRSKLYTFTVNLAKSIRSATLIERMISLVPLYTTNKPGDDYAFVVQSVEELVDACALNEGAKAHLLDAVLSVICSICSKGSDTRHQRPSYSPFASVLRKLAEADPSLLGEKRPSAPAAIAMLLSASSAEETDALLGALEASVGRSSAWCPYATAVLRGSLVELQCSSAEGISKRVSALLHKAKHADSCGCREICDTKYAKHPLLIAVETMHRELCQTWTKGDAKEVSSWAPDEDEDDDDEESEGGSSSEDKSALASSGSSSEVSLSRAGSSALFTLFFRPFLMHPAASVRDAAMEVAVRRCDVDELALLTAVLQTLQEGAGEASLKALLTVAHFARCRAAVTPVLSALVPLTRRPALFPTAVRALELVWELQPRTAGVLFRALQRYSPRMGEEGRLAVAQTVRDVARADPTAAATELMHVVLAIVRGDASDVCVSLGLEALDSIASAGGAAIDFPTIDAFVRAEGLLLSGKRASRVVAAGVRLLGGAAARRAAAASHISSGETTEIPEEDAAAIRGVIGTIAPLLRSSGDALVRTAVLEALARFPTEFTAELLSAETVNAICADECPAARSAGLALLAKLGAVEASFRGAAAASTIAPAAAAAQKKKKATNSSSSSDEKARKALAPLAAAVAEEWAEDSRTGSSRGALCGALVWAGGVQGAGAAEGEEELWDTVGDVLDSLECGRGWLPRVLALSALSTFAHRAAPALITDSAAAERLIEMLDERAAESPARGEVCAFLAGAFAAALPLAARPHAATLAQAARRWAEEEDPEAQFLCGCRVAAACCEGVLLGGSDFAPAAAALVAEYTGLVADGENDEWDRAGAALGLAAIASFVAETAAHRSKAEGVAALLPAYKALRAAVVDSGDEYDGSAWWAWLGAVALASVALALLALDCADPASALFGEALAAAKGFAGDEECTQWQAVSCVVLARCCEALGAAGKLAAGQRTEALDAMLAAATAMNGDDSDAEDTVRGGWLVTLAALANATAVAAAGGSKAPAAVEGTLALVRGLAEDADSLPSQGLCLDVFVACANILGAGVAGGPKPWPLADGPLGNAFARCAALEDAAPALVQTIRDAFESDEVGVAKAATWAIGALCRPLPEAPAAGDEPSDSNSAIASAAPSSSAFAGMPVARLVYETLVEGAKQEAFTTVSTALTYLSRTQRLPNIKWDNLLKAIFELNNEEVKRRCFGFIRSRVELANKGVGALARDVAVTCLPLYSAWLQPPVFTTLSEALQAAGAAALGPLAAFSYADFHNCVLPLLHTAATDATTVPGLPALLGTLCECTQMKCDVPDKMIDEYAAGLLKAFNAHPSPLSVAGPRATIDARLVATLGAVAGALFHMHERKGTLGDAVQSLLTQPLIKGPCASPSKVVLAACALVRSKAVPAKALSACRKWCGDVDRRNAALHVTATACAAQVAAAVLERGGDRVAWVENVLDTLLAGAPGALALPTMLEGALSVAPFQALCRRPHEKRLGVAASAGRSSDCLLNGYLPLELAKVVAAARGGKADKVLDKIAALVTFCSKEECVWEVPMARMLFSAMIPSSDPVRHIDNQLMKWL